MSKPKSPCEKCKHCFDNPKTCRKGCEMWAEYENEKKAFHDHFTKNEVIVGEYFRDSTIRSKYDRAKGRIKKGGQNV